MRHKVHCKHCGRYLFDAVETTIIQGLICTGSKCKARLNIKVVFDGATAAQLRHKFTAPEGPPKALSDSV